MIINHLLLTSSGACELSIYQAVVSIFFKVMTDVRVLNLRYEYTTISLQVRANDIYDGIDEGYESSRDEISSVSSYNPMREPFHRTFGSSLSFQSSAAKSGRFSMKDSPFTEGERLSLSSNVAHPGLSVAEVLYDSAGGFL